MPQVKKFVVESVDLQAGNEEAEGEAEGEAYITVRDQIGYTHAIYREIEGNIPIDAIRPGMDITLLMDDWLVFRWKADETVDSWRAK